MNPSFSCYCYYNSIPGTVTLTNTTLTWKPEAQSASVTIQLASIKSLLVSPPTSDKSIIKILLSINDKTTEDYKFYFVGSESKSQRDKFKEKLSELIGRIKGSSSSSKSIEGPPSIKESLLTSTAKLAMNETEAAESVPSSILKPIKLTLEDIKIRSALLSNNRSLLALHKELVLSGKLSENEFWNTRKNLLLLKSVMGQQQKAIDNLLVTEIKPTSGFGGEIKYTLTPNMIESIFAQFSAVKKAYKDTVPNKITEKDFWVHYFQSKLFSREKQGSDPNNIIDKYLSEETEASLKKQEPKDDVKLLPLLDFLSTANDYSSGLIQHQATDKNNKIAELAHKYNQHSESVLKSIQLTRKPKGVSIEDILTIEDLEGEPEATAIPLEIRKTTKYFTLDDEALQSSTFQNKADDAKIDYKNVFQSDSLGNNINLDACMLTNSSEYDSFQTSLLGSSLHSSFSFEEAQKWLTQNQPIVQLFGNVNEILKHFWSSFPPKDEDSKSQSLRMAKLLESYYETLMQALSKPSEYEKILSSLTAPILKALEKAKSITGLKSKHTLSENSETILGTHKRQKFIS